jgi:hypothetical protein
MSLFRSEDHLQEWLEATSNERGAVLTLEETWQLARVWYLDPRDPSWRPRSPSESQAVLSSAGLTGAFWQLT